MRHGTVRPQGAGVRRGWRLLDPGHHNSKEREQTMSATQWTNRWTSPQTGRNTDRQVKRHEFVRQEHEQTGNQRFAQIKLNRVFPPEPLILSDLPTLC